MTSEKKTVSDRTDPTDRTDRSDQRPARLRPRGGYRHLRSFQVATIVYDGTVAFCRRFVDPRSRLHDQMVQAARSGRQNIAEGSRAGGASSASEVRLTNVARASLDELVLDFEDILRQRNLPRWSKDSAEARAVREVGRKKADRCDPSDRSDRTDPKALWRPYASWLEHEDPGVAANALICLIHQANYLLDRQIAALERGIIEKGGYREQLTAAWLAERRRKGSQRSDRTDPSDRTDQAPPPACPQCQQPMVPRSVRQGTRAGSRFWGCSGYPACKGTRPLKGAGEAPDRIDPTGRADRTDPSDPTDRSDRKPAPRRSRSHAAD